MRNKLPDRRASWTQSALIESRRFYLTVGEYPNGHPGEIFITVDKYGTFTRGVVDSLARSVSIALQNDTPLSDVIKMLRSLDFPPSGRIIAEGSPVERCSSVSDWVAQELEAAYIGQSLPEKVAGWPSTKRDNLVEQ